MPRFRFLAPVALAALAHVVSVPAAHAGTTAAPPFNASLARPFSMAMRGATTSEAWVSLQAQGQQGYDEGVVDLKTGCIVETMPAFTQIARLRAVRSDPFARGTAADQSAKVEALMTDAAIKADIVRFVAAGRRFGQRQLDNVAFSADGKTIAVGASEVAFRSHDGGQTYDRLDANMSRSPAVTSDGKWVLYERCSDASRRNQVCPDASREVRIVAADNSTSARTLAIGSGLLRGMDPTGQKLVVVRYDMGTEVTVMHVDPVAGTITRAFGIPSTAVKKNRFHDIEPSPKTGAFGVFDDNDDFPTNVLTVVSMTDGKVAQKHTTSREMGTQTDDESGRIMWQTYPDDHAWARKPGGTVQDLGMGEPLGWAPGGRALVFASTYAKGVRVAEPPATLGAVACKLVRITTLQ